MQVSSTNLEMAIRLLTHRCTAGNSELLKNENPLIKMHESLYTFNHPNVSRIGLMASVMNFRRKKGMISRSMGYHQQHLVVAPSPLLSDKKLASSNTGLMPREILSGKRRYTDG